LGLGAVGGSLVLGAMGSMAKILIRNVLIGFGVGLVLVIGLTLVTG
jgi:hypothetical protein